MQFLIDQGSFKGALQVVGRIVPKRPVTPVVSSALVHVQRDQVRLNATDLQCYAEVTLKGRVHAEGEAAVDAHFLQRVISTLDETDVALSLSDSGESLRITAGMAAFRLRTQDPTDFPRQEIPSSADVTIPVSSLIDLVTRTTFCAADSDDVSPFAGVLIFAADDGLTLAATDGYQLAHYRLPASISVRERASGVDELKAVVPTQGLTALTKALAALGGEEARLVWHERSLWFLSGSVAWRIRRLDLQYPNLSRFTGPLAGIRLQVDRRALLDAVRQVSSIADEGRAVGLRIDGDRMHVFTSHREIGDAQTVVQLDGDQPRREVWVDAQRLAKSLRAQPEEHVAVYVSEPLAPVAIEPASSDSTYRAVLTPLRQYRPEAEAM